MTAYTSESKLGKLLRQGREFSAFAFANDPKVLDRNRRVTAVPFQKPGIPASVGLTLEECEATVWAIAPDGGHYRGAEAVNALVAAALGTAVPLLLYYLPGIRHLQDFIYSVVASNRSRLSDDQPYCAQHPAECR